MKIEVLFFGITADLIGEKAISFDVSEEMTIKDIKEKLLKTYPKLVPHQSFTMALNMEYAEGNNLVKNGDAIALIPPVSGG
ncbi:MAG: MoaD/ThiS family protein [Flavobacteriaceae bacterium]|nr:MoaD/ThiS family protein [Flavobacteriaceae bacterium]